MTAARLKLRVQPGAKRSEVVGWQGEALRIRVQAPPLEGRANEAVIELLARTLGVPKRQLAVRAGGASRDKLIEIEGLTVEELADRLPARV